MNTVQNTAFKSAIFGALILSSLFLIPQQAHAATFLQSYVRLDRVKAATAATGLVCAQTPAGNTGTDAKVAVTFPSGFTVNGTAGNWTVATTDIPDGATAWPGIDTATAVSSQTVTFPSTALSTSTLYCFRWTGGTTLTNSTAGNDKSGSIETLTSGDASLDTGNYAVSVIAEDQLAVTATVPLIYTMALSGTSMPLGTLSTSSVTSSTARTLTIGTNAAQGWIAWIKGANGSSTIGQLTSTVTSASIVAPATCADNTPSSLAAQAGYVVDVDITTDGSGTGTITQASGFGAEYAGGDTSSGGSPCTTLTPIGASSGTTDGDILTLTARAKVSAVQAAATDYADTLTVVSTGRF